jgi:tRNA1(Val) A37 N6-methylase TrmN6
MDLLPKQDLAVNIDNKHKYGEVHTPYKLINQMFDLLPTSLFTDPHRKWLDPGAGRGYFSLFLVEKLMDGLSSAIPDPQRRKRHILTNMLWIIEINEDHIPNLNSLFPNGNIIQCDFLSLTQTELHSFDVIIGNPPFNSGGMKKVPTNNERNKKEDGQTIWSHFIKQSVAFLKPNGMLLFIVPSIWMKEDRQRMYFYMTQFKLHKIHTLTNTEMNSCFKGHAQTPSCFFLMEKKSTDKKVLLYDKDATSPSKYVEFPLRSENIIPVMCAEVLTKILPYVDKYGSLSSIIKSNLPQKIIKFNASKSKQFPFANIKTCIIREKVHPELVIEYSDKPCPFYGKKKLVLAHGMYGFPFIDTEGNYGISNRDKYVYISDNMDHLRKLHHFLSSDLAFYLYNATRYRMKYLEKYIFSYLPNILLMREEEIQRILSMVIPQKNKYKTIS